MDFDEIMVKENPGLCRCCLSEGCYKDLSSEYSWMSETEVYADMLFECFDISISQHTDGPNGPNRLICEVCITRLRDACNFKKQVLDSEKKFVDMMAKGDFQNNKAMLYQSQMKAEMSEIEVDQDTEHVDFLDDDLDYDDIKTDDPSMSGDITVAALPIKNKRGRPRKNAAVVKSEKKTKLPKTEEKPRSSKVVTKEPLVNIKKEEIRLVMSSYLPNFIEATTAIPFKSVRNLYLCYYCKKTFLLANELIEHTDSHDIITTIEMTNRNINNLSVNLHIEDLTCRFCSEKFVEVEQAIRHIQDLHDQICDSELIKYIVCYKLTDEAMHCLYCGDVFNFFSTLQSHIHKVHFKLKACFCDICGLELINRTALLRHMKCFHDDKKYNCRHCRKEFPCASDRTSHEKHSHDVENCKCPICDAIFPSCFIKDKHLANFHNIWNSKFKCEICPLAFRFKNRLLRHVRRVHLKEKNATCDVCGHETFTKSQMKYHKITHSNDRDYVCVVCDKRYTRRSALVVHMRSHNVDQQYKCSECDSRFNQKISLKLHLKNRHGIFL